MKRKRRGGAPSSAVRRREHPRPTHVRPGGGQPAPTPAPTPATGRESDGTGQAPAPPAPVPDELPPPVPAGPWLSWRGVRALLRPPPPDPVEAPWARNTAAALILALMAIAALLART